VSALFALRELTALAASSIRLLSFKLMMAPYIFLLLPAYIFPREQHGIIIKGKA
jgi:hypothetical protein